MFFLPQNQRKLLNSLNPLFSIGLVFGFILVKTGLFPLAPSFIQKWDVLLPFVVFFGQRRALPEGIVLSLFASHVYSLGSVAPMGVFTTTYLIIFVAARLISYVFYAGTSASIFWLMLGLSLLSRLILPLVAQFFGAGWPIVSTANFLWWSILLNGAAGWVIYVVLVAMDQVTHKTPRSSIELAGDHL